MENASKALIIAAAVLIAILILSLFTYLNSQMAESTSKFYAKLEEHEISEFNQQFLNYAGNSKLKIQDVVTIINLAKDNNQSQKRLTTIKVFIGTTDVTNRDTNELMKTNLNEEYTCASNGVTINSTTLLVEKVTLSGKIN